MVIDEKNINDVRKEIQKLKKNNEKVVVLGGDDEFNRKILENKDVDYLLNLEFHERRDRMKQRDSGLNEVLCKLSKKNEIKIGVELDKLRKMDEIDKAHVISRIIQNISLSKRVGNKYVIYPEGRYKKQEIMSLITSLSGSTIQGKEAKI